MEILKVKNLSLDFDVTGEVAGGYRYTGVECGLKSVPVVGLKSALASLNTITIPKEELDVSGARANIVKTIDLNDYLPEGVSLAGKDSSEITVTLTVEQLKERGIYGPHQRLPVMLGRTAPTAIGQTRERSQSGSVRFRKNLTACSLRLRT